MPRCRQGIVDRWVGRTSRRVVAQRQLESNEILKDTGAMAPGGG
jgi:hypothetical protein